MKHIDSVLRFVTGFIQRPLRRRVHFPGKRGRETLAEHIVQFLVFCRIFREEIQTVLRPSQNPRIHPHDMAEPYEICKSKRF